MARSGIVASEGRNAPAAAGHAQGDERHSQQCVEASGHFCANCGQETTLALPSAGRFLREAAGRYVAFDGRLWRSLHALLFRPGFLTREYLAGRRRHYVRPARLFVALSIVLFAILAFSANTPSVVDAAIEPQEPAASRENADTDAGSFGVRIDRGLNFPVDPGTTPWLAPFLARVDAFNRLSSDQKAERLFAGSLRYAPYAAIALLPVFALLLKLAYAGSGLRHPSRPRLYAAHLVFGAHNHAFLFLVASLVARIEFAPVRAALSVWTVVYALVSMKAVFGGRWPGVVLRALFVAASYALFFVVAIAGVMLAAVTLR